MRKIKQTETYGPLVSRLPGEPRRTGSTPPTVRGNFSIKFANVTLHNNYSPVLRVYDMSTPSRVNTKTSATTVQEYMNAAVNDIYWTNLSQDGRWRNLLVRRLRLYTLPII